MAVRQSRKGKWLVGNPEWEAVKAAVSDLTPAAAATRCAYLSAQYRRRWPVMSEFVVDLYQLLATLAGKKIPFVLTGAHGISSWTGRPRATHDVDILTKAGRNQARAVKAIRELYPELETRVFFGVTAFFVPGEKESVIDVTYPHRRDGEETLRTGIWTEDKGVKFRVPALECALANKYGAMLSLSRDPGKRTIDAADFYNMVRTTLELGRVIDLERLVELGEMVWPGGGGEEMLRFVEEVKAGRVPSIDPRPE